MAFDLASATPVSDSGGFDLASAKPVESASKAPAKDDSYSLGDLGKDLGSAFVRPIAKAVTALPGMAADFGVAARNLGSNLSQGIMPTLADFNPFAKTGGSHQETELPTTSFNRALDSVTRAPTGAGKAAEFASTALLSSRLPTPQATGKITPVLNAPAKVKTLEDVATAFKPSYTNQVVPPSFGGATAGNAPSALTGAQQQASAAGQSLGMRLLPGQQTGSKALQQLEAKLESSPWTSGPINDLKAGNQSVLNRAAAKSIGETGDTVDSNVLARANERLGGVFDNVGDPSRITIVDPAKTKAVIDGIDQDAEGLINGSVRDNTLVKRLETLTQTGGVNGQQLRQLSSKLGKAAYKQMGGPDGDRDLGQALYGVKNHVDDLIEGGLTGDEQATYAAARQQYRNLMLLTSRTGIVNPNTGNVAGVSLASKLQQADKSGFLYGRNQSDLYNAARFSQAFKPVVGDSGTSTRSLNASDLLAAHYGIPLNLASRLYASRLGQAAVRGGVSAARGAPGLLSNPTALSGPVIGGLLAAQ